MRAVRRDLDTTGGQERYDAVAASGMTCRRSADERGVEWPVSGVLHVCALDPVSDTDDAKDVYRYDAETGALERVSVGEAGMTRTATADACSANGACNATHAS